MEKNGFKIVRIQTWGGLGVGFGRPFIKKRMDRMAKRFNFGDVMALLVQKA